MLATDDEPISLAAKWAPSEGKHFNREAKYIAIKLFPNTRTAYKKYRKLLTRLRTRLNLVERKICSQQWSAIDYAKVPSRAHKLLRNTFQRHDKERYESYVEKCTKGEAKINSGAVYPHELVHACLRNDYNDTIEVMWKDMVSKLNVNLKSSVAIVDVSGSMEYRINGVKPIEISIALGLMVAELGNGPFQNRVLTFDDTPTWHMIEPDTSLLQKVKKLKWADWGGSTNLRASFDLILDLATSSHCKQEDMPQTLYIFSDMQFNEACKQSNSISTFEYAKQAFALSGYSLPSIVFWNLNGRNEGVPIQMSEHNTALVSGFSPNLLKLLMNGKLDPVGVMEDAIRPYHGDIDDEERYEFYGVVSFPIHSWDDIPDDEQLEMVLHDTPDLDKFTKVGNNVFLQRFRGGILYRQMLHYFTPRENCYFYIHHKGEDMEEALRYVGNVTQDEIKSIRRWGTIDKTMRGIHNGISDDNLLAILPTHPNLYLISYHCE
jgi:Mg-chelatase subunit ChlD